MARKLPNPANEALRELALQESSGTVDISHLREKTSCLHTAWLFDVKGKETLQMLCWCLGATKDSPLFQGWEAFGIHLGLNSNLLKCIRWSNLTTQGPAYETLLAYIQQEDATLDKVIIALQSIGRCDIIQKTYNYIDSLAENIAPDEANSLESGYLSVSSSGESDIIKPRYIPVPPLVLQNLTGISNNQQLSSFTQTVSERTEERYQNADAMTNHRPAPAVASKKKYDCTVMLTFALDGLEYAQEVAKALRKERRDGKCIGVVILDEHTEKVNCNPEQFILGCFVQVKYVVPIITEGYLQAAISTANVQQPALECVDTKHVRRIYDLMNKHYGFDGCLNRKIRCVVPDHLVHLTQQHWLMRDPLFSVWERLSNTDQLSERMLKSRV